MKNKKYYEKDELNSKEIVSNISDSLKQMEKNISELEKSKQKTDGIIEKFDIDCYKYNLVEEMSTSKEVAEIFFIGQGEKLPRTSKSPAEGDLENWTRKEMPEAPYSISILSGTANWTPSKDGPPSSGLFSFCPQEPTIKAAVIKTESQQIMRYKLSFIAVVFFPVLKISIIYVKINKKY